MSRPSTMIPLKKPRKSSQQRNNVSPAEQRAIADCVQQLQQIGDKFDLKQKILNAIAKILSQKGDCMAVATENI